jgi:hypothetical protein
VFAAMGDDGAKGTLELVEGWSKGAADGAIRVEWKDAGKAPIYDAQDKLLLGSERLGGMYLRNPLWKPLPESLSKLLSGKKPEGNLFTVHPLGGCPMGEDWKEGVVDDLGQVYDPSEPADLARVHPGLLVLDGSIVPVALGINPLLTITALAERATQRYMQQEGWLPSATQARFDTDPPALPKREPAKAPETMVRFSERMHGPLRFAAGGEQHETALEVTFDPIGGGAGGLLEFLRAGPHQVNISEGSLAVSAKSKREEDAELEAARRQERDDAKRRRDILNDEPAAGRAATDQKLEVLWREIRDREARQERERLERARQERLQAQSAQRSRRCRCAAASGGWSGRAVARASGRCVRSGPMHSTAVSPISSRMCGATACGKALQKGGQIAALVRLASHVGEVRYLRYELKLGADLDAGGTLLPAGTVIKGRKTFRYAYAENPWQQLSWLKVSIEPERAPAIDAGTLEIDLKHLIRRFTAMFQITRQSDQPTAMMDVGSIAMFMLRIVAKIHFWSFRAPEYEPYDGERAQRRLPAG